MPQADRDPLQLSGGYFRERAWKYWRQTENGHEEQRNLAMLVRLLFITQQQQLAGRANSKARFTHDTHTHTRRDHTLTLLHSTTTCMTLSCSEIRSHGVKWLQLMTNI